MASTTENKLTPDKLANTKWKVTKEQSKQLIAKAYDLTFDWKDFTKWVDETDDKYIYFYPSAKMVSCPDDEYFKNHENKEMHFKDWFPDDQ